MALMMSNCTFSDINLGANVMAVQFVYNTHYMFSAGRDHLLKYWDAAKVAHELLNTKDESTIWKASMGSKVHQKRQLLVLMNLQILALKEFCTCFLYITNDQ